MTLPNGGPLTTGGAATPDDHPHRLDDRVLQLPGGGLHIRQDGPRDAPALLLIHGSASSTRAWDPLVPLLTGSHRVIRVDLLGFGGSAKPDNGSYALPDQARRTGAVLDRLGVGHAVVAGHSSGGAVATALAEERPGLVNALVLINTGPALDAFITPQPTPPGPATWPPTDAQLRVMASTAFSRPGYRVPPEVLDDVRRMTPHTLASTMQSTTAYLQQRPLPGRLAAVGLPLLVIFGADDRRWRSASAADYRAVPGATVELLPGLGHSPMLEAPERTAAPLLAFAARHSVRAN